MIDSIKLRFRPANEKQKIFLDSTKKAIMLSGAVGAGKTFLGCVKGFMLNMKYPGNRGLICRKENRTLHNSTILTLLEKVIPKELIVSYSLMRGELVHKTNVPGVTSTIIFSGLDKSADAQYPTKIASTEYGWIFVDEGVELHYGDWDMLMTRLRYQIKGLSQEENDRLPRQIFTATNPDAPSHFLYEFFINLEPEKQKKYGRQVIYFTPYDNPYLSPDYLATLEHNLQGVNRQRLLEGKWIRAEGVIYPDFNPIVHVDNSKFLPINDYKELIIGADANFPQPRAWVLLGFKGDGCVDVLDEFYIEKSSVEEAIEWAKTKMVNNSVLVYHDPSAAGDIDKINRNGVPCSKADNKVIPGISEVSRYFINDLIRIHPDCVNLIKELQTYRWKRGREQQKDMPEKVDDHAVDALRYGLYSHREGAGSISVFFDDSGFL